MIDCYQFGLVTSYILERVKPKDFNEMEFSKLRTFWNNPFPNPTLKKRPS